MGDEYLHDILAEQLDRNGFFVWPKLLPEALIDQHLAGFEAFLQSLGLPKWDESAIASAEERLAIKKAQHQFHWDHGPTQELIFNARLIPFLKRRFRDEPVMRQPSTGFYERRTPAHTDSLEFKADPRRSELRMWCALEDVNPSSGPVYFVPGSHKLISMTLEEDALRQRPEFNALLKSQLRPTTSEEYLTATRPLRAFVMNEWIPGRLAELGLTKAALPLKKGDVVVFSPDVVHGTFPCLDRALTRKYLIAFWAAKNAQWFHARAYWGSTHDFRSRRTRITAAVEQTPFGYRMRFADLHAAFVRSFQRAMA